LVSNNFIAVGDTTITAGTCYGIYSYDAYYHNYYFNSVNIIAKKSVSSNYGIYLSRDAAGTYGNVNEADNIVTTTGGGYALYVTANAANNPYISASDYNCLYTKGANICYWNANESTLAKWQSASGMDANAVNANPTFFSSTNLGTNSKYVAGKGDYLASVPVDIANQTRPNPPSIGAYESNGTTFKTGGVNQVTLNASLYDNRNVALEWNAVAIGPDMAYTVERSTGQNIWEAITAPIPAEGGLGDREQYSYTDNNVNLLLSPVLYYRILQDDNGLPAYSNVQEIALAQPEESNSVKIWYDANEGFVHIIVTESQSAQTAIRLVDMKGNTLTTNNTNTGTGATEIKIDMAAYANGAYSCIVTGSAGTTATKFVKY